MDRDINRLRQQLDIVKKYLIDEPTAASLNEFDSDTEDILADAFGSSSPLLDTYEYAQLGEAAGLMNLPEGAPEESATHQSQRDTIRQRQRVLESGIADLEARRASALSGIQETESVRSESLRLYGEIRSIGAARGHLA